MKITIVNMLQGASELCIVRLMSTRLKSRCQYRGQQPSSQYCTKWDAPWFTYL